MGLLLLWMILIIWDCSENKYIASTDVGVFTHKMDQIVLQSRTEKAMRMIKEGIKPRQIVNKKGMFFVPADNSVIGFGYLTSVESCTCMDHIIRKVDCKHMFLVRFTK